MIRTPHSLMSVSVTKFHCTKKMSGAYVYDRFADELKKWEDRDRCMSTQPISSRNNSDHRDREAGAGCSDWSQAVRRPEPRGNGSIGSKWHRKRAAAIPQLFCQFCKKNGEDRQQYTTHVVKDANGTVVCPVLRKYKCPICNTDGGDYAHTKRHCPMNPDPKARWGMPEPEILRSRLNSVGRAPGRRPK